MNSGEEKFFIDLHVEIYLNYYVLSQKATESVFKIVRKCKFFVSFCPFDMQRT